MMADETVQTPKPIVITRSKPGEPPQFEIDLQGRVARAQAQFKQAHGGLYGPPPEITPPETPVETTPLHFTPAEPDATLPEANEDAPSPESTPEPALVEPPASPPPQPPQDPAPSEPPVTTPVQDSKALNDVRAALRRAERDRKKLERELEELRKAAGTATTPPTSQAPPAAPPATSQASPDGRETPVTDDDPFGIKEGIKEVERNLRAEWEQRERTRDERTQQESQQRFADDLNRNERAFLTEQPDYYQAVQHIADWERQRFQLSGQARRDAARMVNDPQWRPTIERIADEFVFIPDPHHEGILQTIERNKLTAEQSLTAREMNDAEAAVCLATDLWIRDRRNDILQSNSPADIPRVVWEIATKVAGYSPQPKTTAPATTNGNGGRANSSAAERIRQQARVNAAARTTANLTSGMPGEPQVPQIRSMAEWSDFHRRDPAGARRYAEQMSRRDPNWHRNLAPA